MAEENFAAGETISDEAAVSMLLGEQGANPAQDEQAAPDAEAVIEAPEGEEVAPEDLTEEVEQEEAPPAKFTVKIDGKDVEVTQEELLNGYQRQADYTRKTTEIAQQREVIKRASSELLAALQYWQIPRDAEPDWADLAGKMDPREFQMRKVQWDEAQKRSAQAAMLHERIVAQETAEALEREKAAILTRIPEWRDASVAKSEFDGIIKAAGEFGFTPEEVQTVADHRLILMARELSKLKGAQAALKTQKQATPPMKAAPAGRASGDADALKSKKLLEQARKTGSDDDIVALLLGG